MKRITQLFFSLFIVLSLHAQQTLPIGGWHAHLPYFHCKYVTGSPNYIWAATDNGLFALNRSDNSVQRIGKIEGLSDLEIGTINYNPYNGILFIGYKDGNIDLLIGSHIINIPDIKRSQIIGNKNINRVYFIGPKAYVCTGFGIVVINMDRYEVSDTYLIGPNGSNLNIFGIVSTPDSLYAATENGIYRAPLNSPFLSNFATWNRLSGIPSGHYTHIALFNNRIITNYTHTYPTLTFNEDTLYQYSISSGVWDTVPNWGRNHNEKDLLVAGNSLLVLDNYTVSRLDNNFNTIGFFYSPDNVGPLFPNQIYSDNYGQYWVADDQYGLEKLRDAVTAVSFYPNGPITSECYALAQQGNTLLTVPGAHDDSWNNLYNIDGVSAYSNGLWTGFNGRSRPVLDTFYDVHSAAIDPNNENHWYFASWGIGVLEMNNGAVVNVFNEQNSTLRPKQAFHWVGIPSLAFDSLGNLWVVNSHVVTALNVRKTDGTWQAINFSGTLQAETYLGPLMITSTGKKWVILTRTPGGILVYDDNGTISNTADDRKKILGFTAGSGAIPGTTVNCMAEDQDGEVWVGTDAGIGVFYCADNVFDASGCDAQQILINQDGYVQILLQTQNVTSIAVDGANRKWIGTQEGGVYLMSSDGTKQLQHFTSDNSPLLSDDVTAIAINQTTGEVFFGTDKGICSYQGDAVKGEDQMGDVYAFPNPVAPDYHGPIAIRGVVKDADVKIADIRGNVVYQTKALGGQAIWDGNNFKGERAASGVYLVFISNEDGTEKAVTKILLIN